MKAKTIFKIIVTITIILFIMTRCCIYTSILTYTILNDYDPVYCVGKIDNQDHYHAWIKIGNTSIEQSRLNLYHSSYIDYDNPDYVFNSTDEFINNVDMLSPINFKSFTTIPLYTPKSTITYKKVNIMINKQQEYEEQVKAAIDMEEAVKNIRDVSNLSDYETITMTTPEGEEIKVKLYGR